MNYDFRQEAQHAWSNARRKAFWKKVSASLRRKDIKLYDYAEVTRRLNLHNTHYKGLRSIPLNKIVGSVGRYNDFIEAFLPITKEMAHRWEHIARLTLDPHSGGLPPIEVYKIGDAYFVKDGNHRVSVANEVGLPDIEGYVWEYPLELDGLSPDTDIDTLLKEYERLQFLTATRLPPDCIELSEPGGYPDLLHQIACFHAALQQIDETDMPFENAALDWYEMIYKTSEQILQQQGICDLFPYRTAADAFVFVRRHQNELQERYGRKVHWLDAAEETARQQQSRLKRLWKKFKLQKGA